MTIEITETNANDDKGAATSDTRQRYLHETYPSADYPLSLLLKYQDTWIALDEHEANLRMHKLTVLARGVERKLNKFAKRWNVEEALKQWDCHLLGPSRSNPFDLMSFVKIVETMDLHEAERADIMKQAAGLRKLDFFMSVGREGLKPCYDRSEF